MPLREQTQPTVRTVALLIVFLIAAGCAGVDLKRIDPNRALQSAVQLAQAAVPIDTEKEIKIGRGVAAKIAGKFGIDSDPALTRYVALVGTAVAGLSDRADLPYRFAVLNSDTINAFAAPGGFIFVTRGAIRQAKDEAELAGILAHEVAHVTQRHVVKEIQKANLIGAAGSVGATALDTDPKLFEKVADFAADLLFKGLAKEDEYEADRLGTEYASRLGYFPLGLRDFITSLASQRPGEDKSKAAMLFATHPKPADRVAMIDRYLGQHPLPTAGRPRLAGRFERSTGMLRRE
ncbi:MAG: peptidase [Candidatus Manganitrophaceae bacterium]|nr:MAG: peptidase [Candidatus Manganitrophaceae bacterium]